MPLPIKASEYGHCMELLSSLGIGDALNKDCQVEELTRAYPTLRCLEGSKVNIDELDYRSRAEVDARRWRDYSGRVRASKALLPETHRLRSRHRRLSG